MTDEEILSALQGALGRARGDLMMVMLAIRDGHIGVGVDSRRLMAAAELIEKTQNELSTRMTELLAKKNIPPLPVPGPGRG